IMHAPSSLRSVWSIADEETTPHPPPSRSPPAATGAAPATALAWPRGTRRPDTRGREQPMAEQLERRERAPARFGGLEYAPAPEATDHVTIRSDHGLLIGGRGVGPPSGEACNTTHPAPEGG